MVTMTDSPLPPRPTYPMRYVFPAEITDLDTAHGLPTETLIRALNMRRLVDGRGNCWSAGSGSGMTLKRLLDHGALVVEWLPPIPEEKRIDAIDRHLGYAVQRRRHLPDNAVALMKIPAPVAETRQARNRASYRISVITDLLPKIPALNDALGDTLRAWLTDRMAELGLTVEQAQAMTAHQFPMTLESLAAEWNPVPEPSPDDTCAECYHSRDDHDTQAATCEAERYTPGGKTKQCDCDTFTEVEVTRR